MLHQFDLNIGGNLSAQSLIPKEDKHKYLVNSIMEEAIASSQIEGAVTSRRLAKEMLRKNTPPKTKSEQMIFNNYQTIQRILEIKHEPLTEKNLLEIHLLVTRDTMQKPEEGAFRKTDDIHIVDVTDEPNCAQRSESPSLPGVDKQHCHRPEVRRLYSHCSVRDHFRKITSKIIDSSLLAVHRRGDRYNPFTIDSAFSTWAAGEM